MRLTPMLAMVTALAGCEPAPRMHAPPIARMGDEIAVTLDAPLVNRPTNQYWIALQPADAPPIDTTGRVIVENGDRLHDGYPAKAHHLVARVPISILYRADWQVHAIRN